ncbi:MAG: hypothetical protein GY789_06725 [Hyphomicrobiales bacterium]|nr:hypothetical protein [Hyphomicrobiales bacterium]
MAKPEPDIVIPDYSRAASAKNKQAVNGHILPDDGDSTGYEPHMASQVFKLALLGMTDTQIANFFEVTDAKIVTWREAHPNFRKLMDVGKQQADSDVAYSLYQSAVGGNITRQQVVIDDAGDHHVVDIQEQVPGDPQAAMDWLTNRQPAKWQKRSMVYNFEQPPYSPLPRNDPGKQNKA